MHARIWGRGHRPVGGISGAPWRDRETQRDRESPLAQPKGHQVGLAVRAGWTPGREKRCLDLSSSNLGHPASSRRVLGRCRGAWLVAKGLLDPGLPPTQVSSRLQDTSRLQRPTQSVSVLWVHSFSNEKKSFFSMCSIQVSTFVLFFGGGCVGGVVVKCPVGCKVCPCPRAFSFRCANACFLASKLLAIQRKLQGKNLFLVKALRTNQPMDFLASFVPSFLVRLSPG